MLALPFSEDTAVHGEDAKPRCGPAPVALANHCANVFPACLAQEVVRAVPASRAAALATLLRGPALRFAAAGLLQPVGLVT